MSYSNYFHASSTSEKREVDFNAFEVIINHGSAKQIHDWVKAYPYLTYKQNYDDLFNQINKGNVKFIWQGKTAASMKKCHSMQSAFLSIYDLEQQLSIMAYFNYKNCRTMMEFFPLLKFDNTNLFHQKMVQEHKLFSEILTKAFHIEDFDTIDYLEKLFKTPFMEHTFNYAVFIFERPLSISGELSHDFEESAFFKPYYDIIYNYSSSKETWLNNRHLTIPNQSEIDKIRVIFEKRTELVFLYDELYAGLNNYEKILNYYSLNEKLNACDLELSLKDNLPVQKI